ncbi:MAG TPA: GspH/FimT family pseudopilin [Steroidobacteraceae bacterium]|jgi:prepilin-type N-terminal cleavage/methylation domain-containing protein|nr:GspH/FimT family pseudopilin [Steroidobacteraceae bacterium]
MDKSRHHGFTLIELMITVCLVGILLAAVIPNMSTFLRNNQLSGGVNDMLHSIQTARTEAIKRQTQIGNMILCGTATPTVADPALTCDYATFKAWFVFQDLNNNWQHDAAEPVIERHGLLDANVTVKTDGNARLISFAPSGFASPAGLRVPMRTLVICDSRGVQQVGNAATARALLISVTGHARASSTWQDVNNTALPQVVGGTCP